MYALAIYDDLIQIESLNLGSDGITLFLGYLLDGYGWDSAAKRWVLLVMLAAGAAGLVLGVVQSWNQMSINLGGINWNFLIC